MIWTDPDHGPMIHNTDTPWILSFSNSSGTQMCYRGIIIWQELQCVVHCGARWVVSDTWKECMWKTGMCQENSVSQDKVLCALDEYPDSFEGLGYLLGEVSIKLKQTAEPTTETCRNVPFKLHVQLKEELERRVAAGIIEPIKEPTDWVHTMHIVHKWNGQLCLYLDPRNLNRSRQRENYKLPTREEITAKICGMQTGCHERVLATAPWLFLLQPVQFHNALCLFLVPTLILWDLQCTKNLPLNCVQHVYRFKSCWDLHGWCLHRGHTKEEQGQCVR